MITNHYGHTVDSEVPTTGVVSSNSPEFINDDLLNAIDYDCEMYILEHEEGADDYYNDEPTYLIGFKRCENDKTKFEEDENAEYSAICTNQYTQITRSGWTCRVALCSPCYPGQGDLETAGGYLAYTLPPKVWGSTDHLPISKIGTKKTNWQIRINVFDSKENAFAITYKIEALGLGYNHRIINVDRDNQEMDDDEQCVCKECGRVDGNLHYNICEECLNKRKQETIENDKNNE